MLCCMIHNFNNLKSWTSKLYRIQKLGPIFNMANFNIRWAFKASEWKPTKEEMLAISSYIQPDEKERIAKFVFQDDAKSSLVGRLLLRKFVHVAASMPYEEIRFGRDAHGKPILVGVGDLLISFNVSHQGDYVVLAGNNKDNIGVDVMKIEPPVNKDIPDFFRLMTKQFSEYEWSTIRSFPTELEQVACFYRIWSLKESYVKNLGYGVTIPLIDISFHLKTRTQNTGEVLTDTVLYENNILKHDWVFEETLLESTHTVAVSFKVDKHEYSTVPFTVLTYEELLKEAKPSFEADYNFASEFVKKELKNF